MNYALNCRVDLGTRVTGIPLYANVGVFANGRMKGRIIVKGPLTNGENIVADVLTVSRTHRGKHTFNFEVVTSA